MNNSLFLNHNPPSNNNLLGPAIEKLISDYQTGLIGKTYKEKAVVHVDEIASKIAFIYERIRKIVDWKEENILRRNAIERIIKRYLVSEISTIKSVFKGNSSEIAEALVLELIRGGHLPNDQVLSEKIDETAKVIEKYIFILKNTSFNQINQSFVFKTKVNFFNWILEIASCEIEEILAPPFKENALIEAMTTIMSERIRTAPSLNLSEKEKKELTYIAVYRTLFDLDDAIIAYHLIKKKFPFWTNTSPASITQITEKIFSIWGEIQRSLTHPLSRDFFNYCENTDTVFTILGDILEQFRQDPSALSSVIGSKETYSKLITKFYNQRLTTLKSRLFKLAVFSTLSVFVSNWFSFFIVEVPLAHLFYQGFNLTAAIFDFLIPSAIMFILVAIIRPPSRNNLAKVLDLSFDFVYKDEEKPIYEIQLKKRRKLLTNFFIILFYLTAFFLSFGSVAYLFYLVKIPVTSIILDTIGIALNVFAALVIRNKSREITVEEKTSFWEFLLDILSLPIAEAGSWLASKWKEYNVASAFFNVIIEIPFVTFIEFIENWRQFIKERKADIH